MLIDRGQVRILLIDLTDGLPHLINKTALRGRCQAVHILLARQLKLQILVQLDQLLILVAHLEERFEQGLLLSLQRQLVLRLLLVEQSQLSLLLLKLKLGAVQVQLHLLLLVLQLRHFVGLGPTLLEAVNLLLQLTLHTCLLAQLQLQSLNDLQRVQVLALVVGRL